MTSCVRGVGIDALQFYVPPFAIDLSILAKERGIDPEKFRVGLGQEQMAIMPPDEDVVTMAANAAAPLLDREGKEKIRLVLFATESSVDQSKAAGLWVHHLLSLPSSCRVVELKQACYSATCALQLASSYLKDHLDEKVLLLAADNARYGLNSSGEPTQGCGAIAMILSSSPRLLSIEPHQGISASHAMDFWRPNYRSEAIVDGKYSTRVYLNTLIESWSDYCLRSSHTFEDHDRFCYHIPFSRMARKAYERLAKQAQVSARFEEHVAPGLVYSTKVGNAYTAALYIGLVSMLENDRSDLSERRIGLFSYGSGSVGEFFSGIVQSGYQDVLSRDAHAKLFEGRSFLSYKEYEKFFNYQLSADGGDHVSPQVTPSQFRLLGVKNHERLYGA